jgi:Na+/H+-dicarboxylate symporter
MQHPLKMRTCRFYMGELLMSVLALSAAMYGMAAVNRGSFSVFLMLQGASAALPKRRTFLILGVGPQR